SFLQTTKVIKLTLIKASDAEKQLTSRRIFVKFFIPSDFDAAKLELLYFYKVSAGFRLTFSINFIKTKQL
ncbi:MAG: hypothetical protein IJP46_01065, partial [Prevotella sp.]|nr:hypothetical protein [Prevotella sp.]